MMARLRPFPVAALLGCLVTMPVASCSCESRCERQLARFERGLEEREAELARLLDGSRPVRLELAGGDEPPRQARRVLVTGEGIHSEDITCTSQTLGGNADKWLEDCREHGEWPFGVPEAPQPVESLDAIEGFVRAPADPKSLCVPLDTVLYVGRDADAAEFAAAAEAWPGPTLDVLAEMPEGVRSFTIGAVKKLSPGELRARRAAEAATPPKSLQLTVNLGSGGALIGGSGGTLAPGCEEMRPPEQRAPTVSKRDGRHDASGVRACLESIKAEFADHTVLTVRARDASIEDVVAVLAAAATTGEGRQLFPNVILVTQQ